jgi:hypothetical protein
MIGAGEIAARSHKAQSTCSMHQMCGTESLCRSTSRAAFCPLPLLLLQWGGTGFLSKIESAMTQRPRLHAIDRPHFLRTSSSLGLMSTVLVRFRELVRLSALISASCFFDPLIVTSFFLHFFPRKNVTVPVIFFFSIAPFFYIMSLPRVADHPPASRASGS